MDIFFKGFFLSFNFGTSIKVQPRVSVFDIIKAKLPITLQVNIFFPHINSSCWNNTWNSSCTKEE